MVATLLYVQSSALTVAFLLYLAYVVVGPGSKADASCSWKPTFRKWRIWKVMVAYFPGARLVKTADLDPTGRYLFVSHPHGIIAISNWLAFGTDALGFSKLFPGLDLRCSTLTSNFWMPGVREYILAHGMCGVGRDTLKSILSSKPGRSVMLVVGGASEALLAAEGTYDLVLRNRKGFARLALQTGASLVPVINYGETDTFHTYIPPPSSRAAAIMKVLKQVFGFSTPLCWGTGLFGGWGMIALQVPLTVVVGAPIKVDKVAGASEAQVAALHKTYTEALLKLWADTSDKYGKGVKRPLTIVQ
ncbi:hypothetical protein HYH02_013405 [Chlamydomonas schloesseri]|uniref:Acyltransferase n=1 Tax=Chlamydomonas schloesseri TaxID=2026947 RepID=A0A835SQC4_9CHLO|nr:hypothetical protein HYH02_013405 [Chlamydomonas schloesseri]|eukprot:KAG2431273.1 hypothetical protein HYH02_013405 [Chlamydomonas schloesseri]